MGTLNHVFLGYEPYQGLIDKSRKGSILSTASGSATSHALANIEARGKLFIKPGDECYPGMIIGEHSRDNDIDVNPVRAKQLTNMRASGREDLVRLTPPEVMSLEKMISYIQGNFNSFSNLNSYDL